MIEDKAKVLQGIRPEQKGCVAILHDAMHVSLADPYCSLGSCLKSVLVPWGRGQRDVAARSPGLERCLLGQLRCIIHSNAADVQPGHAYKFFNVQFRVGLVLAGLYPQKIDAADCHH